MGPTSPSVAFAFGAKSADPVQMYLSDIYTISTNLAGLPGMSLPCGFGAHGMPVGLQLIGPGSAKPRCCRPRTSTRKLPTGIPACRRE
jgi:aspartyl-tRNA(Asn)/glutamyl-tRNA(Gln) amidotransferase subunit A